MLASIMSATPPVDVDANNAISHGLQCAAGFQYAFISLNGHRVDPIRCSHGVCRIKYTASLRACDMSSSADTGPSGRRSTTPQPHSGHFLSGHSLTMLHFQLFGYGGLGRASGLSSWADTAGGCGGPNTCRASTVGGFLRRSNREKLAASNGKLHPRPLSRS